MKIIEKSISDIIPYENNPRHNDDAVIYVQRSIAQFGFRVPIVIDKDNVIVAGHTRLKAAAALEMDTVPCIIADDLTPEQIAAYRVVDNQTATFSTWDYEKLERELAGITKIDMSEFELNGNIQINETVSDDNYEISLPEAPKAERGQLYQLGRHYLMCGDSTDPNVIDRLTGDVTADMLLTDPPYNVDYIGCTQEELTMNNDNLSTEDYFAFMTDALTNASNHIKPGAVFYLWYADSQASAIRMACLQAGLDIHQIVMFTSSDIMATRIYLI